MASHLHSSLPFPGVKTNAWLTTMLAEAESNVANKRRLNDDHLFALVWKMTGAATWEQTDGGITCIDTRSFRLKDGQPKLMWLPAACVFRKGSAFVRGGTFRGRPIPRPLGVDRMTALARMHEDDLLRTCYLERLGVIVETAGDTMPTSTDIMQYVKRLANLQGSDRDTSTLQQVKPLTSKRRREIEDEFAARKLPEPVAVDTQPLTVQGALDAFFEE